MFQRYSEANPGEVQKAWNQGGQQKLNCFKKFVTSGCNGAVVEAVMKFTAQSEMEDKDAGEYCDWAGVLDHFQGDVAKSQDLVNRRRGEASGTVWVSKMIIQNHTNINIYIYIHIWTRTYIYINIYNLSNPTRSTLSGLPPTATQVVRPSWSSGVKRSLGPPAPLKFACI